ncbi:MAG: spore cortex biosynthesis protein YabQ [Ruminococcus sp.]|nr:spore cortex biosynthesis protein YabQ [Ruminococcus sp.]
MIIPDTFLSIHEETVLFIGSVFLGAVLSIVYSLILAFRAVVPHKIFSSALEDVLFILFWTGAVICFAAVSGKGVMRFFYIAGTLLGFTIAYLTIGRPAVRVLSRILSAVCRFFRWLFSPFGKILVRFRGKLTWKFVDNAKNKGKRKNIRSALLIVKEKMLYNNNKNKSE